MFKKLFFVIVITIFLEILISNYQPIFAQYDIGNAFLADTEDNEVSRKNPVIPESQLNPQLIEPSLQAVNPKPNIIFIIVDDQPPQTLGISGNNVIKTPNIDNLARGGTYFKNMFLTLGQCVASRTSILTSKLPHTTGITGNKFMIYDSLVTLPEILQQNGFYTAIIGKCMLGDPYAPETAPLGFDYKLITYPDIGTIHNWYNFQVSRNGVIETKTKYLTDYLTDEALTFLQNRVNSDEPFFLWLSHPAPHVPTTPPVDNLRYNLEDIPLPVSVTDNLTTKPRQQTESQMHVDYLNSLHNQYPDPLTATRNLIKREYEVISRIDDNVGRVINFVNQSSLRDNTIIIYMSDNGMMLGEHQMFHKGQTFYNEQIKSPFIINYPSKIPAGRQVGALVSSLDIMPTILDLLGISKPSDIQGISMMGLINGTVTKIRNSVFMEYYCKHAPWEGGLVEGNCPDEPNYPMRGVVSGGYKFVHYLASSIAGTSYVYDGKDYELYNLNNDPHEMNNILRRFNASDNALTRMNSDPVYGSILRNLRKEMAIWQTDTQDPHDQKLENLNINANNTSLTVSWTTNAQSTSEIEYRPESCSSCAWQELNNVTLTTAHNATLSNLLQNTNYSLRIFSSTATGNGGYITATMRTLGIRGDLNGDGRVNSQDFIIFSNAFVNYNAVADINGDNAVNILDYVILSNNYQGNT